MLKILRKGAIENPWLFRIIMLVIAITFIGTMGWMGLTAPTSNVIAEVNGDKISMDEFRLSEKNARDYYRNLFQDNYSEDLMRQFNLKKRVLDELIEKRLWLDFARQMDLDVSNEEVRENIVHLPAFQKKGRFDRDTYNRYLAFIRAKPETFEKEQRELLLIQKAKELVRESVMVTGQEIQPELEETGTQPDALEQKRKELIQRKQDRAVFAFTESLKAKANIFKSDFIQEQIAPVPVSLPPPATPQIKTDNPSPAIETQEEQATETGQEQ
ncbi:MAG TPA: SurA N-terminal domain-containing protein [Nitrospiria bacterium]